jgi:NADPH:quinone reductase
MRALVYDPGAPHDLRLGEAPDPRPAASQVMIRVAAASLNFADVAYLRDRQVPGAVPGFDAAGVVISAAADGSGPPAGTRVVTFGYSGGGPSGGRPTRPNSRSCPMSLISAGRRRSRPPE